MSGGENTGGSIPYLGVLGGMGPRATADFFLKLIAATAAENDQEHIPTILRSVPQIPDRSAAIMEDGPSPLPALVQGVHELCSAGATAIAIPCNTAHHWYPELAEISTAPIFHIADTVVDYFTALARPEAVGVLATEGTIKAGVYQKGLIGTHIQYVIVPSEREMQRFVSPGIAAVKAGNWTRGEELLLEAARVLHERGATSVIMACTEIPVVLGPQSGLSFPLIDATNCLAEHCVRWWYEHGQSTAPMA